MVNRTLKKKIKRDFTIEEEEEEKDFAHSFI